MSGVITDKQARWTFPRLGTFFPYSTTSSWSMAFSVLMLCGMKMREYGNVMVFEVNMYYKINLDEDLPIPLIRRGDWRLIFNCKSNYMEQIASDIWLSTWLIKRLGCQGRLSASWFQTKEKIKKSCPVCNHEFQGWNYKAKHLLRDAQHPFTLCLSALLFHPAITAQDPCDMLKEGERIMLKNEWRKCLLPGGVVQPSFMTST